MYTNSHPCNSEGDASECSIIGVMEVKRRLGGHKCKMTDQRERERDSRREKLISSCLPRRNNPRDAPSSLRPLSS